MIIYSSLVIALKCSFHDKFGWLFHLIRRPYGNESITDSIQTKVDIVLHTFQLDFSLFRTLILLRFVKTLGICNYLFWFWLGFRNYRLFLLISFNFIFYRLFMRVLNLLLLLNLIQFILIIIITELGLFRPSLYFFLLLIFKTVSI